VNFEEIDLKIGDKIPIPTSNAPKEAPRLNVLENSVKTFLRSLLILFLMEIFGIPI